MFSCHLLGMFEACANKQTLARVFAFVNEQRNDTTNATKYGDIDVDVVDAERVGSGTTSGSNKCADAAMSISYSFACVYAAAALVMETL